VATKSKTRSASAQAARRPKAAALRAPARKSAAASPGKEDTALRVLRRFRTVFNAVRNHFRMLEQAVGLTGTEVWALSQVAASPGMGVGQLAAAMDIHQSTASNLVRALLDARMVVSERSEGDLRAVHLHATARGLKLLLKAPTPFVGVLPEALRRLDDAALLRLERDLGRLLRELQADPEGAQVIISTDRGYGPRRP
jgi:DNA-binding MarR family transcriptional regulator